MAPPVVPQLWHSHFPPHSHFFSAPALAALEHAELISLLGPLHTVCILPGIPLPHDFAESFGEVSTQLLLPQRELSHHPI